MGRVLAGRVKRSGVTSGLQTFRSPTAVIIWWVWLLFAAANLIDLAVQGRDHESLVAAAILVMATGVAYVTAQRPRIITSQAGITVVNPLRDHHVGWASVTEVDLADLLRVHCQLGPDHTKVIHSWAVHYSRRRKLAAQVKTRRQAARMSSGRPSFGLGGYGGGRMAGYASASAAEPGSTAEADAERIVGVLMQYVTAARAETIWAAGTAEPAEAPAPTTERTTTERERTTTEHTTTERTVAEHTATERTAADPRRAGWLEPLSSTWSRQAILALVIPALILLVAILV